MAAFKPAKLINKAEHIFGARNLHKHGLGDFLDDFDGNAEAAIAEIWTAGQKLVASGKYSKKQLLKGVNVKAGDHDITLRGTIVDGEFELGSAFKPGSLGSSGKLTESNVQRDRD